MTDQASADLESRLGVMTPSASQLGNISVLVKKAMAKAAEVELAEEQLKLMKAELHDIRHNQIPDAMASAGTKEFTTDDDLVVKIKNVVTGSLPKEDPKKRQAALDWLLAEAPGVVKEKVIVEFAAGSQDSSKSLKEHLRLMGYEFSAGLDVHPMTLQALARERLKKQQPVPQDTLNLFIGRMAEIKRKGD